MRVLSLCSGIGGIDLAAEAAGMTISGQVEIDPFCQAVLAKHWPHVTRVADIQEVRGDEFGPIDLVVAGLGNQVDKSTLLRYNYTKRRLTTMPEDSFKEMYHRYCEGETLASLAQVYGVSKQAISKGFQRRGYPTRGFSGPRQKPSLLPGIDDKVLIEAKEKWDQLDTLTKGTIAEGYVKNRLAELGFDVWIPYTNNHKSDMAVLVNHRFLRIQVKSATYSPEEKRFRTMLQTRDRQGNHIGYKDGVIDFFIVFCPGIHAFYVIPASIGNINQAVNMIPHRHRFFELNKGRDWEQYFEAFHLLQEVRETNEDA